MKKILIISATNDKNLVLAKELDNIISNNQALIEAVDSGLELTNSNVDALIKQFK